MAQDISKLISYLQSSSNVAKPGPSVAPSGQIFFDSTPTTPYKPSSLFDDTLQGAGNIFSGFLRGVTSVGRGVTNLANEVLPAANKLYDIQKDGIQGDEWGDYASTIWDGLGGAGRGFLKGLAYSFMSPTQKSRNELQDVFGGKEAIEGGYELFQGEDYAKAAKNVPFLEGARSDETLFKLPAPAFSIPFLGIEAGEGFPVTQAGLWSFGWDVVTDPASYVTLGVGGAVKGVASGVSKGVAGAVAKKKYGSFENIPEDVPTDLRARPFYGEGSTFQERRAARMIPLQGDAAYNAVDTNPFVFLAKESGRGFVEAHKNALNIARVNRDARILRKRGTNMTVEAYARAAEKGLDVDDPTVIDRELQEIQAELVAQNVAGKVDAGAVKDQDFQVQINKAAGDSVAAAAESARRMLVTSPERAARLAEITKSVDPSRVRVALRADAARAVIRSIKEQEKLVPAFRKSRFEPELTSKLGDDFVRAQGTDAADISEVWNEFVDGATAKNNKEAIKEALRTIFMPVGHREVIRRTKKAPSDEAKKARQEWDPSFTKEMQALQALIKTDATRTSPKATKGRGVKKGYQASSDEINSEILAAVEKFFGKTMSIEEIEGQLDQIVDRVMAGENLGPKLTEAFGGLTQLPGERLRYAALRDATTETPEKVLIDKLRDREYNPFTYEVAAVTLNGLPLAATRNKARAISLLSQAGGDAYNPELAKLLKLAGVRGVSGTDRIVTLALDVAHAAIYLRGEKLKRQMTLRVFNTKLGKFNLSEQLGDEVTDALDEAQFAALRARAEKIAPRGALMTDEQISRLIELAGQVRDSQIRANVLLESGFRIPLHGNGDQLRDLGNTDHALARKIAKQGQERYAPTREADEIGKITGAFNDVKKDIGVDENGNIRFAEVLVELSKIIKTPEARTLLSKISKIIYKENPATGKLRPIQIPATATQLITEVKRDIGNAIKDAQNLLPRDGIPGFTEIFTTRRGQFSVSTMADFMGAAYNASRSADSIDGGRFADYIDEFFLREKVSDPSWSGQLSVAARAKVLKSYTKMWGGEGLTPGLLQHMLAFYKKPGKPNATAVEKEAFKSYIERVIQRARETATDNLSAVRELKTFDSSAGWLKGSVNNKKKGEKGLTDDELKLAREAYFGARGRDLTPEDQKLISDALSQIPVEMLFDMGLVSIKRMKDPTKQPKSVRDVPKAQINFTRLRNALRTGYITGELAYAILNSPIPVKGTRLGRLVDEVVSKGQRAAEAAVIASRAEELMLDAWPASATLENLKGLTEKMSLEKAYVIVQAEMLLAKQTSIQDILVIRANKENQKKVGAASWQDLEVEQGKLNEILNKVSMKLQQAGEKIVPRGAVADKTWDEVKAMDSDMAIVAYIPQMKTLTEVERRHWREAMDLLTSSSREGTRSPYKTAKDAIQAWRDNSPDVSDETILKVLAEYGFTRAANFLNRGKTPRKDTIAKYILDAEEMIEQAELEKLRLKNAFAEAGLIQGTADDVAGAVSQLPPVAVEAMVDDLYKQLVELTARAEENGYGWLTDLAIASLGDSAHMFFRLTQQPLEKLRNGAVKVSFKGKDVVVKPSKEIFTQYTEFSAIVDGVRQFARKAVPDDISKQDALVADLTIKALRFREIYYLLRGVVPAATPMMSRGASEIGVFSNPVYKQLEELTYTPVFLSDADVLEALDSALVRDILFMERTSSMPYSSIMEGARVLVAHMEQLKPGEWFSGDQYQAVYLHMYNNMVSEARRSYISNSKSGTSWFDTDVDANALRIRQYIEYMLSDTSDNVIEAPAFRLLEKHRQNAIYASAVAKHQVKKSQDGIEFAEGSMGPGLRSAWEKAINSNILSAGDKKQAVADAFSDLNDKLKLQNVSTDLPTFLAKWDELLLLSSYLDREGVLAVMEQVAIKDVVKKTKSKKKSAEAEGIEKAQAGARKAKEAQISAAQKDLLLRQVEARTDLVLDTLAQKEMALRQMDYKPGHGEVVDMVNDTVTDSTKINIGLRIADKIFSTFSYRYGMEELRDVYGGIARDTILSESLFTRSNVAMSKKWSEVATATGTDYPKLAMQKLQDLSDDTIREVIDKLETLRIGFNPGAKGALDLETADDVAKALESLKAVKTTDGNAIFADVDDMMVAALADIAAPLFHLFGENGMFAMQRAPVNMYNSLLAKIGSRQIGFAPGLSADSLGQAWREIDFERPFEALNGLHFAFAETEKFRVLGVETMRMAGAKKISDFKSLADARAQGYMRIGTVKDLRPDTGTEVLFFMDTDNYLYPEVMIPQIKTFSNFVSLPYRGFGAKLAENMARFSGLQDFAKQMMTTLRPGNHVMNTIGGFFINDAAGLRNPYRYIESARMLRTLGYKEETLGISLNRGESWFSRYLENQRRKGITIRPESDPANFPDSHLVVIGGKGVRYSDNDLALAYMQAGGRVPYQQSMNLDLLTQYGTAENLQKAVKSTGIKKAYGDVANFAGNLAATRDDWLRMALWLDVVKKGNWKSIKEATDEALKVVNRYHPQPQDLAKTLNVVARQLILFFTWRAKTMGTIVGDLLDRPGRLLAYEKAYYNLQAGMGNEPEYFGSHDPEGEAVRGFMQNSMALVTGDKEYSFSVANPMWDLMGTDSWIAAIKWDQNQSPAANAFNISMGTAEQVFYSATPLLGSFILNWAQGRTNNGVDLMRGGITNEDMPLILEEVATSFGLNSQHAALAYFFPGVVDKGSWKQLTSDDRTQELLRAWFNWATGARASKYLTDENQKKAYSELKSVMKIITSRDQKAPAQTPEQSVQDLLDYFKSE